MTADEKWEELRRRLLDKEADAHERSSLYKEAGNERARSASTVAGNTFGRVLIMMAKLDAEV
jgi:hypothetical protein